MRRVLNSTGGTKIGPSRLFTRLFFGMAIWSGLFIPLQAQDVRPETNVELMTGVVESLTRGLTDRFESDSAKSVWVRAPLEGGVLTSILQSHIVHAISKEGWGVSVEADSHFTGVRIDWHPLDVSMQYPKKIRHGIFGKSRIVRKASCNLFFEAVRIPDGTVLWTGSLSEAKQDTVATSALDALEQGGFLFGRPERPGESGILRLFEPLVMVGTVVLLGYLFYTIRS